MCVFHAAGFANGQAFTGSLQFFGAHVFFLARLQAFGSGLVRGGHGAVALEVDRRLDILTGQSAGEIAASVLDAMLNRLKPKR